ncbi:hypothetical protein CDAR_270161 [Caerostris darwini]|uniref:Uncharacterized protein n=1 Tax=Caerostris darwini TaxID=1538125 RepID=A0AAV4WGJ7_9ARAC|nr:hypothetical protein CDAR_270161 [Caerostris darwini]
MSTIRLPVWSFTDILPFDTQQQVSYKVFLEGKIGNIRNMPYVLTQTPFFVLEKDDLHSPEIKTVWIAPPAWKLIKGPFMLYVCLKCHFISKNELSIRGHREHVPNMYGTYFITSYKCMTIRAPEASKTPRRRRRPRRSIVGTRRQPGRACKNKKRFRYFKK